MDEHKVAAGKTWNSYRRSTLPLSGHAGRRMWPVRDGDVPAGSSVSEPATLAIGSLLGVGGTTVGWRRRRKAG